ncbi:MAG: uncharacterized protein KVP18_000440, partial [Porospora cf. gigantea A]
AVLPKTHLPDRIKSDRWSKKADALAQVWSNASNVALLSEGTTLLPDCQIWLYVFQGKKFVKLHQQELGSAEHVTHHPFIRVGLGPQEYDTRLIVRGADAPLFNEWIKFDYRRERYVTFECYDRDALESNALYNGSGSLDLMDFVQSKQRSKNFEIKLWRAKKGGKKDDVGTLLVHAELKGDLSMHTGSSMYSLKDYEPGVEKSVSSKKSSSKKSSSKKSSKKSSSEKSSKKSKKSSEVRKLSSPRSPSHQMSSERPKSSIDKPKSSDDEKANEASS